MHKYEFLSIAYFLDAEEVMPSIINAMETTLAFGFLLYR
jgi:hypothetical protein